MYDQENLDIFRGCTRGHKPSENINFLSYLYELFKMEKDESIKDMLFRSTNIVNGLTSLENTNPNDWQSEQSFRLLAKSCGI